MKYYSSPRWTGEFLDCSMPMTFDTYSVCSYNCLYCFSFFQRAIRPGNDYSKREVNYVSVDRVKKMFTDPDSSQFGEYIKKGLTMQWGGLSDQFDEYERKYGKSLELMKFFREINYPISFSTKATWFLGDERYREIIKGAKNWHFKVSIITEEEEKAKKIEAGVDSPDKRLETIKDLSALGVGGVTLRLRPFIIGASNPSHISLIKKAAEHGADSVSTEFLCLEARANKRGRKRYEKLSEIVGFDIYEEYRRVSEGSGYMRLNRKSKEKFINEMERACKESGLRFYVSDAHFKERSHHGSCCGLPLDFKYNKGQFTEALMVAKQKGQVSFGDIKKDAERLFGNLECGAAEGFNPGDNVQRAKTQGWTLYDLMRYAWNVPKSKKSPHLYFGGILEPTKKDENGDLQYVYKGKE